MATTGFIDGSLLRLTLSDDAGVTKNKIFHVQETSFSLSRDTENIVTKDTGSGSKWAESIAKTKSAQFTANGLLRYDEGASYANISDLYDWFAGDITLTFEFTTGVSGDPIWSGSLRLDNLDIGTVADTESTFDLTATIIGAPVVALVP